MKTEAHSTNLMRAIAVAALSLVATTAANAQGAEGSGMGMGMAASSPAGGKARAGADQAFVMQAVKGGMMEVALGKLAQQKASSDSVKQFGSHMVDDHTKANDELKAIADGKKIMVPAAAPEGATSKRLMALDGAAFDKAYMTAMVADHKKTVALFEKESRGGKDADLKAFATKTLPTLKSHLEMSQQTQASVAKS